MKKFFRFLLVLLLIVVLAVGGLFGWLTYEEYKPAAVESLEITHNDAGVLLSAGQSLDVISWNIGYAGLGKASDFFMDGGKQVRAAGPNIMGGYLNGIADTLSAGDYDLVLLQEVDVASSRTFNVNQAQRLARGSSVHALNYSCPFVPYPLPPIGKVNSGLFTTTDLHIEQADRVSLPCPFSWPIRVANLKRCLLVSYLPIDGSKQQLVLVNLHLEAYDDGAGKVAQTKQLMDFLQSEYDKGNYVIAGGDFNQIFPGSLEVYPNTHPELWEPGVLDEATLPAGFSFAYDLAVPSCRLLNQPYDPADTANTQHYVIDGFILSPNVKLESVETLDLGFENSDHNPVHIQVTLG